MSWLGRIWIRVVGKKPTKPKGRLHHRPLAKYDSAQTANENRAHWAQADGLSANAAHSPDVRYTLRTRSRYECGNNGYAKSLVRGRANATIGVCPRLQLSFPETMRDPDFGVELQVDTPAEKAHVVERRWKEWADKIGLADKLRLLDKAETRDGEAFAVMVTNPVVGEDGGPQLDLRLYETDQCCTPDRDPNDPYAVDGIVFDIYGNPEWYHFLNRHPGDLTAYSLGRFSTDYSQIAARYVCHVFDPERIGETRGIPDVTPSLPLYNQLREFTLAALGSAKLQAMLSGVIESQLPPDPSEEAPEIEDAQEIPFPRNALLTLPAGQTAKGFDATQPTQTYKEFKSEILTEAGRSINAPRNISTGSSAEYNFSSGKLDRIDYEQDLKIRRDRFRRIILDRVFRAWADEGIRIPGYFPDGLPPLSEWQQTWRWDGFASIDPAKDATAAKTRLESGVSSLERECAERGDDWEEVLEQQAREMKKRKALGLPEPGKQQAPSATPPATAPVGGPDDEDDEDDTDDE